MDERAFGAIAGQNIHPFFTTLERGLTIVQAEFAFGFLRAVATKTIGFQNGFDVAGEINLCRGGWRQFRKVRFSSANAQAADGHNQTQTDPPSPRYIVWRAFQ